MRRFAVPLDLGLTRRKLRRWADRLGPVGLIGTAILATCVGYYAGSIAPQREQLEALRAGHESDASPRPVRARGDDQGAKLRAFAADFPAEKELGNLLGALYALGEREGVRLSQGDYRFVEPDALGMVQYKITLPVVASYPSLRRFVAASLAEVPALAVTQINLQRERIGQGLLDARIEMTLHMRAVGPQYAGQAPSAPNAPSLTRAPELNR